MKFIFASYKYHFLILAIAISWLGILSTLLQMNHQDAVFPDAQSYKEAADLLYHHFIFHPYRPVLMPAIMGLPYVFGYPDAVIYQFGFYVNVICWLGNSLLLYRFLREFLQDYKAFFCTIIYIVIIGSALLVFHLLTESLFTFCMMFGFYFVFRYYRNRYFSDLAIALSVLLLSILIKPGSQFFVVFCFLWHIRIVIKNYANPALLFLAGGFLLIGFQVYEMKKTYGDFTVSYISGVTYYDYLGAKAEAIKNNIDFRTAKTKREAYIFTFPVAEQNRIAAADLKNQMQNNCMNLTKSYCFDVAENAKTPSDCIAICRNKNQGKYFETVKQGLLQISKWQNRMISVVGLIVALMCLFRFRSLNPCYFFAGIYTLSVILLSGLSCYQGDRFHVVFYPFVILLAARLLYRPR